MMRYVCTLCGIEKPADAFYADKRNTAKGIRADCKECVRGVSAKNRKPYGEADRLRAREWSRTSPKAKAGAARRRKERPEIARAAHARWTAKHATWYRAKEARRKAVKRQAMPAWCQPEKIAFVYRKAKEMGLTVDHIVPLTHALVCGLHVWENLQLLDGKLNSAKRNRHWPDMPNSSAELVQALTT